MPTTHFNNNFENANLLSSEEHKVNLKVIHSEKVKKKQDRNKFLERISKNCLTKKDYMIIGASFVTMLASILFLIIYENEILEWHNAKLETWWGVAIYSIGLSLLILKIIFLSYMGYLYIKYKPIKNVSDDELPKCTVIVPAYNEGKLVYDTLLSLADSNYPADKLEILAIDDGSKDDTWDWLLKAKQVLGARLTLFQQPENKGKRHALYRGFTTGTGDVFVTVDSDSIVDENTLRFLVSPFVVKKDCGAVAGNVRVLNKEKGIIPKMLNVSFTFSFEFVRSAQSALGSVFCTPGALAAYRKDAVMNCLDEWINQSFLGQPSTIGEDRALTNMILKQGLHVYFQKNAMVFTNIPERYKNLYKMFIRWERSNVRENIMMSKFAFKNFRDGSTTGTRIILTMQWVKLIMAIPLFLILIFFVVTHPLLFLTSTLSGVLLFSSIQMIFYAKKYNFNETLLAYAYSIFYMFTLFWITPYAIITAGRSGWLTRELPQTS